MVGRISTNPLPRPPGSFPRNADSSVQDSSGDPQNARAHSLLDSLPAEPGDCSHRFQQERTCSDKQTEGGNQGRDASSTLPR